MSRHILVIQGHPDPAPGHLCRALADAYADGAREAGHSVERFDIATLDFPLLRSQDAFEHEPVPEVLRPAQAAILNAEHVVLVFPLWHGTMPALVKGFLEQVIRPGMNPAAKSAAHPLAGRSARVVVTMGMPALLYRWWYGAHGLRGLERSILGFVGMRPVRHTLFGLAGAGERTRRSWLARMRALGAKAA